MQYRTLGRTGIKVSPYALGAMMFGGRQPRPRRLDPHHPQSAGRGDQLRRYRRPVLHGESEEIVGKALKGRRDDIVLATKVNGPMGDDPNQQGNSRRWIMTEVEESLRRLQTDYIDLYQIHRPDPEHRHRGDAVRALGPDPQRQGPGDRVVDDARVRHRRGPVGGRAARPGAVPHRAAALFDPQPRHRARGAARRPALRDGHAGVGPAREGHAHRAHPQGRADRPAPRRHVHALSDERRLDAVEQIIPLAEEAGLPMTHLAMAFAIAHPGVTSAIIGPRTMEQLDDLLAGSTSRSPTRSSTGSTRSSRPAPSRHARPGAYLPPALQRPGLRRRPLGERAAA